MINALLVRWVGGWHEVTDAASITAHGRREALLGLGAAQSVREVERIAARQLDIYADVRTSVTVSPTDVVTVPGLGDRVTVPDSDGTPVLERVMARTFTEDENGTVTFAAEVHDVLLTAQQRWEQAIKSMSDGTIRGDSKVATPVAQIGATAAACCAPGETAPA